MKSKTSLPSRGPRKRARESVASSGLRSLLPMRVSGVRWTIINNSPLRNDEPFPGLNGRNLTPHRGRRSGDEKTTPICSLEPQLEEPAVVDCCCETLKYFPTMLRQRHRRKSYWRYPGRRLKGQLICTRSCAATPSGHSSHRKEVVKAAWDRSNPG
ncbi:type VI secretion system Vgr family protein [Anopheles sinensis]|uniref:Type VI secretion system Vgr family protein n=1 Tax=Anopheles sinensis TaxID=74873 RepID=A0A084VJU2_ANOSI|nr:type VI secretion system Vgr family protein [Anopheles sinensis]